MAEKKATAASKGSAKGLTVARSMEDFKLAYRAKRSLIERELEDHRFALGEQWSEEDKAKLKEAGFKPFTDNRIQPNLFLLTGLERQNRTDVKAFPEGEEDGLKADIASALLKDAFKKSGYQYKSSEQFKDGITCGESHLELYLDNAESLINGKPCWKKIDGNMLFPDPASREYDFTDARFVYKITLAVALEDLINLYPSQEKALRASRGERLDLTEMLAADGAHQQKRDYGTKGESSESGDETEGCRDLVERYYKKYVQKVFLGDKKTGSITEAESLEKAEAMVAEYKAGIASDEAAFDGAVAQLLQQYAGADPVFAAVPLQEQVAALEEAGALPPPPPEQDPERFLVIKRQVPEIWCYAHTPGVAEPLSDERAWSYPKWKGYPFTPYFARFSTAPLTGDDRHLLVQGVVHVVKGAQERHNKAEMLMLRHLNSSANSGWLAEDEAWVDEALAKRFGSAPGINLYYKKGYQKPERITPGALSQGHAQISAESAEAIKAQLGINADLLAVQEGGQSSGRAIALRQRQGLLMVQEPYDNLTRTRQRAGQLLLSQLGEIYDTETAMKVLGEAFLTKNFPPVMVLSEDPARAGQEEPMKDRETGQPMKYDRGLAEVAIAEVLSGELGLYDVSVGEAVASESQRMANSAELAELATKMPIPPEVLIRHSQLPEATKNEILQALQQAQAQMAAAAAQPLRAPARPPVDPAA